MTMVRSRCCILVLAGLGWLAAARTTSAAVGGILDKIICVPWQGDPSKFHTAINGVPVRLKGTIQTADGRPVWYKWVFGDGAESSVLGVQLSGSTRYNVSADHAYAGAVGTPFTAQLLVDDVDDSMSHAAGDRFLVKIEPDNLDARVNAAIDNGLWYLFNNQLVSTSLSSLNGRPVTAWASYGAFYPCATGAAVQAFEINNHKETGDPDEDPYVEVVRRGLNWLLNGTFGGTRVLEAIGICGTSGDCDVEPQPWGNPDTNGNGKGIQVRYPSHPAYQGGMVMDAIIASGTPDADTGRDFFRDGSTETYKQVIQEMVDAYAWGQSDGNTNTTTGGWEYSWNRQVTDNSANQWAAIGLIPAELDFGCIIPQFVKDRNDLSLTGTYCATGRHHNYRIANCANLVNSTPGVTRPSGMVQMILSVPGYRADARWTGPESWYAANFADAISPGERTYYGWLSFVKAMRLSGTETLSSGIDWYRGNGETIGLAARLVGEQEADGSWIHNAQRTYPGSYGENLVAAWAIQMLKPALFAAAPIPCFTALPNPTFPDLDIVFDPSCSDHSATGKDAGSLVRFEWDWNDDGTYEERTTDPVAVTHAFACPGLADGEPCTYPVTLRVTDDADPGLSATFTLDIHITQPPHPPTAVAGGPYIVSQCPEDTLTLDGSLSSDADAGLREAGCPACPADTITAWDWDLNEPLTGFDDASGETVTLDAATYAARTGPRAIALRVTDNTAAAYPDAASPDLTNADFTTLDVFPACAGCDLTVESGCDRVALSWQSGGTYEVHRSVRGPNAGFQKIAEVTGTRYDDTDVMDGGTYHYRLMGTHCLSKAVSVDYVFDPQKCGPPVAVRIDVRPFAAPYANRIRLSKPNRKIPVLVLSSPGFNPADLDPNTIAFGPRPAGAATPAAGPAKPYKSPRMRDRNRDGIPDATYIFITSDCGFRTGDTTALLTGRLIDGRRVRGEDAVEIVAASNDR